MTCVDLLEADSHLLTTQTRLWTANFFLVRLLIDHFDKVQTIVLCYNCVVTLHSLAAIDD